jgi:hypothetical protein
MLFDIIVILSDCGLIEFYSKNKAIACSFVAIKTELMLSSFRTIIYNKDIKIICIIYFEFITIKGNKLDIVLG